MAAAVTHVAESIIFTPSGGAAWTLTDLLHLADGEGVDLTELTTDNSLPVNGMFGDNLKGEISASASDLSHSTNAGAVAGQVGSLAVRYGKRAAGKGRTAGAYLTVTYANAVLRSLHREAGVTGHGTIAVTFGAYGTDGATVKSAAVGA
jgi:hypothetical protein